MSSERGMTNEMVIRRPSVRRIVSDNNSPRYGCRTVPLPRTSNTGLDSLRPDSNDRRTSGGRRITGTRADTGGDKIWEGGWR